MILSLHLTIALIDYLIATVYHVAGSIYSHVAHGSHLLVL
jgi:hypothetical protein